MDQMNILVINIRSLRAHFDELKNLIQSKDENANPSDVVILTESWIGDEDKEFYNIEGYDIFCSSKISKRGKGTVFYIQNGVSFNVIDYREIDNCDMMVIKCEMGKKQLMITGIYRNHASKIDSFVEGLENMIN